MIPRISAHMQRASILGGVFARIPNDMARGLGSTKYHANLRYLRVTQARLLGTNPKTSKNHGLSSPFVGPNASCCLSFWPRSMGKKTCYVLRTAAIFLGDIFGCPPFPGCQSPPGFWTFLSISVDPELDRHLIYWGG